MTWSTVLKVALILALVTGIVTGIYALRKYIEEKDAQIEALIKDKAVLQANSLTMQNNINTLNQTLSRLQEMQRQFDAILAQQAATDNRITEMLSAREVKIQGRDLEAIRDSEHSERLLQVLNDFSSGRSKTAPELGRSD